MMAMRVVGDFGAAIAVPVVAFVILGQWLDGKYGTGYKFTIGSFILAALVSGKMIYKKAKQYGKEFSELNTLADTEKRNEKNKDHN